MTAFQILGEPVRLFLIESLCVGEQTSGDLAEQAHQQFGISWSATSRHLVTLRRSGFVRVIVDEMTRWYVLEDGWLDLLDAEVASLRAVWNERSSLRAFGFAPQVPPVTEWPPAASRETRGRRGATRHNLARRGAGRSVYADETDGGAGLS